MKHELSIRDHNKQCHIDLEEDIKKRKNGLFTFTLRINNGNIVDYNVTEYVNAKEKYLSLKRVVIEELPITRHSRVGSTANPLWSDNLQRKPTRWGGYGGYPKHSKEQKEKV